MTHSQACSSDHRRSLSVIKLYCVCDEIGIKGRLCGIFSNIAFWFSSLMRSHLVMAIRNFLSSNSGLYAFNSFCRILKSWTRSLAVRFPFSSAIGIIYRRMEFRSIWRRKRNPMPLPSDAPSMMPGMSAMMKDW